MISSRSLSNAAAGALGAGAVVALATLSVQGSWLSARHHHNRHDRLYFKRISG